MADGAFLLGGSAFLTSSVNLASNVGYRPGQGGYYPTGLSVADRQPVADDALWVLCSARGSTATFTFPAKWDRYSRTIINQVSSLFVVIELWRYPDPITTWASAAPTVNVSGTTEAYATAIALRAPVVDQPIVSTYASSGSTFVPSANVATVSDSLFTFGLAVGYGGVGGINVGLDFSPVSSSQNGWDELAGAMGFAQSFINHSWFVNAGSSPTTLPVFGRTASAIDFYWLIFTLSKTTGAGWSVGRIAY